MSQDCTALEGRSSPLYGEAKPAKARFRARLTNHRDLLPNLDGRSAAARRFRDIVSALAVDQGGIDLLSEARLQLIRRFAATCVLAEQVEARIARGEQVEIGAHSTLASTLVRIGQRIGIDRVPRDIGNGLGDMWRAELQQQRVGHVD
jgi:hypothetical protein